MKCVLKGNIKIVRYMNHTECELDILADPPNKGWMQAIQIKLKAVKGIKNSVPRGIKGILLSGMHFRPHDTTTTHLAHLVYVYEMVQSNGSLVGTAAPTFQSTVRQASARSD